MRHEKAAETLANWVDDGDFCKSCSRVKQLVRVNVQNFTSRYDGSNLAALWPDEVENELVA